MKQSILEGQEREQLIEEITQRVLSRISVSIDAADVIKQIDEINEHIHKLGR